MFGSILPHFDPAVFQEAFLEVAFDRDPQLLAFAIDFVEVDPIPATALLTILACPIVCADPPVQKNRVQLSNTPRPTGHKSASDKHCARALFYRGNDVGTLPQVEPLKNHIGIAAPCGPMKPPSGLNSDEALMRSSGLRKPFLMLFHIAILRRQ